MKNRPSRKSRRIATATIIAAILITPFAITGLYTWWTISNEINGEQYVWDEAGRKETRRRAMLIVDRLTEYHSEHGAYPKSLAALPGEAVDSGFLRPTVGLEEWWYYRKGEGQHFDLGFSANKDDYPTEWYDSTSGWQVDY